MSRRWAECRSRGAPGSCWRRGVCTQSGWGRRSLQSQAWGEGRPGSYLRTCSASFFLLQSATALCHQPQEVTKPQAVGRIKSTHCLRHPTGALLTQRPGASEAGNWGLRTFWLPSLSLAGFFPFARVGVKRPIHSEGSRRWAARAPSSGSEQDQGSAPQVEGGGPLGQEGDEH